MILEKLAPVTGTTLRITGSLCRWTLGSERHRYAIARHDKLMIDPIDSGWPKKNRTPPRKAGGILIVSIRFSLSMEYEQVDAGRDGQTRLARPENP